MSGQGQGQEPSLPKPAPSASSIHGSFFPSFIPQSLREHLFRSRPALGTQRCHHQVVCNLKALTMMVGYHLGIEGQMEEVHPESEQERCGPGLRGIAMASSVYTLEHAHANIDTLS